MSKVSRNSDLHTINSHGNDNDRYSWYSNDMKKIIQRISPGLFAAGFATGFSIGYVSLEGLVSGIILGIGLGLAFGLSSPSK